MNVLIACEFSGIVRTAFARRGHSAVSVDLLPTELPDAAHGGYGTHSECDVLAAFYTARIALGDGWSPDLIIAFPPCTHLAVSGARWFKDKREEQRQAIDFFMAMVNGPAPKIAIENPVGIMSTHYRKPDQIIQPWQFGCGEVKATCLWLKGLPLLKPTSIVEGRKPRVHYASPGPNRWKERSRTYEGIAEAMAEQWGEPKP